MASRKKKSGKQSHGKSAKRPKKFTAYLEAAVGCAEVCAAFDANKIKYKLHRNYANPHTHDDTWLPRVGKNAWVLLTTDDKMQHRGNEAHAIREFRVRSFVFKSHKIGTDMAKFLLEAMPAMRRFCGQHNAPFIAFIQDNLKIRLIMDEHGIIKGPLAGAL